MLNFKYKIGNIKLKIFANRPGQSLIELLVAIGLMAIILPAILTGFVASRENKAQEGQRLQAVALLKESEEAVRSVREKGWNSFAVDGTYHPVVAGSSWSLASGSEVVNGFTRQVVLSSAGADTSTKQVVHTVSWSEPSPGGSVETTEFLSRYIGNTANTQTAQADFDLGTKSNTRSTTGGTIELSTASASATLTDDYTNSADYNFDAGKIEVAGGYAQLKGTGGGTNSTLNPSVDSNHNNWTFALYGDDSGQAGKWNNSGGNPQGNISVDFLKRKNAVSGGYWYQAFTTTSASPNGTLTFDWSVPTYAATPDSLHLFAWIDSGLGAPATVVWDSGNITSIKGFSTVSLNVSSHILAPGTYYLKVGAYLDYPSSNNGGHSLVFDNVLLTWTGAGGGPPYPSDSPTISPKTSFHPTAVTSWDSFTATEVTNGGSIRYQLSDDNGATWMYWQNPGQGWVTAGDTNYNTASEVNTHIVDFPVTSGKIMVKAFLISNGTQLVKLDKIVIGFTGQGSGTNIGTFISSTIDAGALVAFNRLIWTETNTSSTTVQFQAAINSDNATWNYFGADGTSGTYFTGGSGQIPLNLINGRYFRYKIYFSSTNTDLPSVSDVSVNYSP